MARPDGAAGLIWVGSTVVVADVREWLETPNPSGTNRYNDHQMTPDHLPKRVRPNSLGEAFRLTHERWLNRAIKNPRRYPTIPSIRVDSGGFDRLTDSPLGRSWADQWWHDTFRSMDTSSPDA